MTDDGSAALELFEAGEVERFRGEWQALRGYRTFFNRLLTH